MAAVVIGVVLAAGLGGYLLRPAREAGVETQVPHSTQLPAGDDVVVEVEVAPLDSDAEKLGQDSVLEAYGEELSSLKEQLSELEAEREKLPSAPEDTQSAVRELPAPGEEDLALLEDEASVRQQEEEAIRLQEQWNTKPRWSAMKRLA